MASRWNLQNIVTVVAFIAAGGAFATRSSNAPAPQKDIPTAEDALTDAMIKTLGETCKGERERADTNFRAFQEASEQRDALALELDQAKAVIRAAQQKPATKVKANAKPTYDGPLAPVLRHELERVRAVESIRDGGTSEPDNGAGAATAPAGAEGGTGEGLPAVPAAPPAT